MNLQLMYVSRDVNPVVCEVVDLTPTATSNGRLTGRLIPGGPCGGGLEVPPKLNNAGSDSVDVPS